MTYITEQLRREVTERAHNCCEYCLLSQSDIFFIFEMDHIISEKHEGETTLENLCLSCPECNRFKGGDIGSIDRVTGQLTPLFNPRTQMWSEHFHLNDAIIEPLSPEGRVTVFLLRLNLPERVADRQLFLNAGSYPCGS